MSEYQCFEFLAIDRPLTTTEQAELRRVSSRAEISPARFWNEYEWGDLKADPAKLVERYFDAHLYFSNWGTRRLILRIPRARVERGALKAYFVGRLDATLKLTKAFVLIDLDSEDEEFEFDERSPGSLAVLAPLRTELMRGDLRPAYLAWLIAVSAGEVDDDDVEPPVPPGLGELTPSQQEMVGFLRIDSDLVAAAASASAALTGDGAPLRRWLLGLSASEKDAWLKRAVDEPDLALGGELIRTFQAVRRESAPSGHRRTVAELRALAESTHARRQQVEAQRARRLRDEAGAASKRWLAQLAVDLEGAWERLETLVANSRYDEAISLAVDLRDLAAEEASREGFDSRFEAMRKRNLRRRGFFDRWKRLDQHATARR